MLETLSRKTGRSRTILYALNWRKCPCTVAITVGSKSTICQSNARFAIYKLMGTARTNGIHPEAYLRFVLARITDHPINRVHELELSVIADRLRVAV
ncbi:hypothetical protein CIC12_03435 [Burkholderia sp. SG-MS1]|nr:hypothetical protein [Paraburkholderia sp. SG-MS1]